MKPKKLYIPCVNCGINTNRLQRRLVANEYENFRELVGEWTCKELEDDDVLCNSCYHLVNESLESNNKIRKFGCKSVCLSCGVSILQLRTHDITNEYEQKLALVQWVQPHQVKRLKKVCMTCWLKADRAARMPKRDTIDIKTEHISTDPDDPLAEEEVYVPLSPIDEKPPRIPTPEPTNTIDEKLPTDEMPPQIPTPEPTNTIDEKLPTEKMPPQIPTPEPTNVATITLKTYRRAANTSKRCVFKHCNKTERLTFPKLLKERLLIDFSFYVPNKTRICDTHLNNVHNEWHNLFTENSNSEFTAVQIEDLCSLLQSSAERYYSNEIFQSLIRRKDVLCKYWLGVDYTEFEDMLEAIEPVKDAIKFKKKSLAMYLMKRHLGFTDEKVASFFKISVALMNKNFSLMNEYLENSVKFVNCDGLPIVNVKEERDSLRNKMFD